MCRFHLYQERLADKSANYQDNLIKTLRSCRLDQSLSRLQAAESMLLNLKARLRHEQLSNLSAAIKQAIEELEATT